MLDCAEPFQNTTLKLNNRNKRTKINTPGEDTQDLQLVFEDVQKYLRCILDGITITETIEPIQNDHQNNHRNNHQKQLKQQRRQLQVKIWLFNQTTYCMIR